MQEQPELVSRVAQNARRMRELLQRIAGLSVSFYVMKMLWQVFTRQVPFVRCMPTVTTSNAHNRSQAQQGVFHLLQPLLDWLPF